MTDDDFRALSDGAAGEVVVVVDVVVIACVVASDAGTAWAFGCRTCLPGKWGCSAVPLFLVGLVLIVMERLPWLYGLSLVFQLYHALRSLVDCKGRFSHSLIRSTPFWAFPDVTEARGEMTLDDDDEELVSSPSSYLCFNA